MVGQIAKKKNSLSSSLALSIFCLMTLKNTGAEKYFQERVHSSIKLCALGKIPESRRTQKNCNERKEKKSARLGLIN